MRKVFLKLRKKFIKTPVKLVMQGTNVLLPNTFWGRVNKYTMESYVHNTQCCSIFKLLLIGENIIIFSNKIYLVAILKKITHY